MKREIHEKVKEGMKPFIPDLENFFDRLEKQWEDQFIKLFEEFSIRGIVKTDKYSLPYQEEIVVKMQRESYVNGMYEFSRLVRPVIKKLLEEDVYKVRFYIHAETYDNGFQGAFLRNIIGTGFKYSFRYYLHK